VLKNDITKWRHHVIISRARYDAIREHIKLGTVAFPHDLTIKERNFYRSEVDRVRKELGFSKSSLKASRDALLREKTEILTGAAPSAKDMEAIIEAPR
jgi:hypothetical protein